MDPFTAFRLIKQIEKDNKKIINQSQKKTFKKEQQNNCSRCGQNSYWCQCPITNNITDNIIDNSNVSPQLSTPPS